MLGAEAVLRTLRAMGVERIFASPLARHVTAAVVNVNGGSVR